MPISDPDGYDPGHFQHGYDDIIKPAIVETKFKAWRADEAKNTNLIQVDILKELLNATIAICDLSSRNPNVLFELGIRQAFDKPVVLIQEEKTPKIFDISGLRYIEYSRNMKYHQVIEAQEKISQSINATMDKASDADNMNSIIKLLALDPANIPSLDNKDRSHVEFSVLQAQINEIKNIILRNNNLAIASDSRFNIEYNTLKRHLEKLAVKSYYSTDDVKQNFSPVVSEI